jgi:hypothetical protein
MLAVSNAHFELAATLLDAGAYPNFAPQDGRRYTSCRACSRPGQQRPHAPGVRREQPRDRPTVVAKAEHQCGGERTAQESR